MSSRVIYGPVERKAVRSKPNGKKILLGIFVFLLSVSILWGAVYLLRLPKFFVRKIEITGAITIDPEILREEINKKLSGNYLFLFPKNSYFLVSSSRISKNLINSFPKMKEAKINKDFPDSLSIEVSERKLWGILCHKEPADLLKSAEEIISGECVYLDDTGFAMESAPDTTGSLISKIEADLPEIRVGTQVISQALMDTISTVKEKALDASAEITIFSFSGAEPQEMRLKTIDGYELIISIQTDFANEFSVLRRVLEEEIKDKKTNLNYIDLRFGNKVFYKFR